MNGAEQIIELKQYLDQLFAEANGRGAPALRRRQQLLLFNVLKTFRNVLDSTLRPAFESVDNPRFVARKTPTPTS